MKDVNEGLYKKLEEVNVTAYVEIRGLSTSAILDGGFEVEHLELILEQLKINRDNIESEELTKNKVVCSKRMEEVLNSELITAPKCMPREAKRAFMSGKT